MFNIYPKMDVSNVFQSEKMLKIFKIFKFVFCFCVFFAVLAYVFNGFVVTGYANLQFYKDVWIESKSLKLEIEPETITKLWLNEFKTYFYANQTTELKSHPKQNSATIGVLSIGDIREVMVKNDEWYAIAFDEKIAYILLSTIQDDNFVKITQNASDIIVDIEQENETNTIQDENVVKENETKVNYSEINETVYAIAFVNIRTGAGTEYEKIGSLSYAESITRIGIGDNGWSKVIYKNQEAYISSNYLSTQKPVITETDEYLYVNTNSLNVRTGPGAEYEKLAQ